MKKKIKETKKEIKIRGEKKDGRKEKRKNE